MIEYSDKPVCDSCGGKEFKITEIKKPTPETRYIPASQHFKPMESSMYITTSSITFAPSELTQKATCKKCGREYLY